MIWVNQNIASFGGNPAKVTMQVASFGRNLDPDTGTLTSARSWGGSAGSVSVALHMVTNGGDAEGLFRGTFMVGHFNQNRL